MTKRPLQMLSQEAIGTALILIYIFGIAFKGTFAKLAYQEGASVMGVLLWRFLLSVPVFWATAISKLGHREVWNISREELVGCTMAGLAFYAFVYCDYKGLMLISVSMERIILFTYPVFVILLNIFINRRLPGLGPLVALIVVQAGIAALMLPGLRGAEANTAGEIWVFASAIFHAIYILYIQKYAPRIGAIKFTTYAMTVCFAAISVHFLLTEPMANFVLTHASFIYVMKMVLLSTVIPTFCFAAAIGRIGGNRAAIISVLGPFITVVSAHFIFGDTLAPYQIVAGLVIVAGVSLLDFIPRRNPVIKATAKKAAPVDPGD